MTEPAINFQIKKIKQLLDEADHLEGTQKQTVEAIEQKRWEGARLIAEQLDAGMTTRALATAIERSHSTVVRFAKLWRSRDKYSSGSRVNQSFDALLHMVASTSDEDEQEDILAEAEETGASVATIADNRRL